MPANIPIKQKSSGAVLVFALVVILLMSLVGGNLLRAGIFHERLAANSSIDALSFLAAESVIDASVAHIARSETLRQQLIAGKVANTCMHDGGVSDAECDSGFPLAQVNNAASSENLVMLTQAITHYSGNAPVPGYSVETLVNQRFVSEGRAYFDSTSGLPFGHVNVQTWQTLGSNTGIFYE